MDDGQLNPLVEHCVDTINAFYERHNMKERVHMKKKPQSEYATVTKIDKISPAHYKEIVPGYEYMDMMVHMLKDFEGVEAHLMGQVYKYLMRYGKKDDKTQELKKAQWYLNYLIKHNEEK
jgi:hypothetical protein